jgi:excisionase family DNA binding protein
MSSNIFIQRICDHCSKEFTARTTVTKFCSDACAKRAYKARKKADKIKQSDTETLLIKNKPIEDLKAKEFLSVKDIALLLGCSIRTAYRLIDTGKIRAVNLSERLTRVKRSELNKIMEQIN